MCIQYRESYQHAFNEYFIIDFRKAKTYHPDVNPSEEAKAEFLRVRESFRALSNPMRRSDYDRKLFAG